LQPLLVVAIFDGLTINIAKMLGVAEKARHQKIKQRPKLAQVIF
jgi:hypothetical protein